MLDLRVTSQNSLWMGGCCAFLLRATHHAIPEGHIHNVALRGAHNSPGGMGSNGCIMSVGWDPSGESDNSKSKIVWIKYTVTALSALGAHSPAVLHCIHLHTWSPLTCCTALSTLSTLGACSSAVLHCLHWLHLEPAHLLYYTVRTVCTWSPLTLLYTLSTLATLGARSPLRAVAYEAAICAPAPGPWSTE
jgi:hypothetical protein